MRVVIPNTGTAPAAVSPGYYATILVSEPDHLFTVQWATREICRTLGYDEAGIDRAVMMVSDLADRRLIASARPGKLHLAAVGPQGKQELEARVET